MFTVLGGGAGDFRILQRDVGSVLDEVGGRHRVRSGLRPLREYQRLQPAKNALAPRGSI
jgi:hypothetical protein